MYKKLKVPRRAPVDVSNLRRLTPEEQRAQHCDVRSRLAEVSLDPDRPVAVTEDHPNLGGRRIFLHLFNALFENVPRVRASGLQKPNMKALHLHSAAYHWQRASTLYGLLGRPEVTLSDNAVEEIGMDFMEAAIVSVYGSIATVDVFCQEIMFDRLNAASRPIGKPSDLVETLRDCLPRLTGKPKPTRTDWWRPFRNIHRARNAVTHAGTNDPEREEEVAKAWDALIAPDLNPPDVARRVIHHFSDAEPPWIVRVIERGRSKADGDLTGELDDGTESKPSTAGAPERHGATTTRPSVSAGSVNDRVVDSGRAGRGGPF